MYNGYENSGVWVVNGNEAIAYAALHSGVRYFTHYPGSPVNGVEPALRLYNEMHHGDVVFTDAINEHFAATGAMGASMSGVRSMLVMKHVGLNIAADPLNYVGYSGIRGGMVIVVGTDPGANSSTGEEDVHWYAKQFNLPLLEPTDVQEVYDTVMEAYTISEQLELPVMVFVTGLVCHNTSKINPKIEPAKSAGIEVGFIKNREKYINVGERAVRNHRALIEKIKSFGESSKMIKVFGSGDKTDLILTRGNCLMHTLESVELLQLAERVDVVQVLCVYPLPTEALKQLISNRERIIVIEDQDGFLENQLKMELFNEIHCKVSGKDLFRAYGELGIDDVLDVLKEEYQVDFETKKLADFAVVERLGTFCEGCPHTASYFAIEQAVSEDVRIIGGDIGCSSLPPFRADWLLCMNAGIGVSMGIRPFLSKQKIISTGGDGSLFHGGLLGILNAVHNRIPLLHIVFDNRSIAMTGHQASPALTVDYKSIITGMGVDSFTELNAFYPNEVIQTIREKIDLNGVHILWINGSCARIPDERSKYRRAHYSPVIDPLKCKDCNLCYESLACPAIEKSENNLFQIDLNRCMRCGVCYEICPNGAISIEQLNKGG